MIDLSHRCEQASADQQDRDAAIRLATMIFGNGHSIIADLRTTERHFLIDECRIIRLAGVRAGLEAAAKVAPVILDGIERTEDDNEGWWDTSTGVDFGTQKLADLLKAIRSVDPETLK